MCIRCVYSMNVISVLNRWVKDGQVNEPRIRTLNTEMYQRRVAPQVKTLLKPRVLMAHG